MPHVRGVRRGTRKRHPRTTRSAEARNPTISLMSSSLLVTGATGYLGRALCSAAQARGHDVRAFVRPGSEQRAAPGVKVIRGNPLLVDDVANALRPGDTLVALIGTPRPNPAKAGEFHRVDLASIEAATAAAVRAGIAHIVYVSVAHPAPVMKAYIAVRTRAEALIRATGIAATILRPWYVIGPGHWWPVALVPVYWLLDQLPATRAASQRLGLVTHAQMIAALMRAIEREPYGVEIMDVLAIRASGS
jgi:uncharacterized protein YbjT (DUF2867 family)